MNPLEGAAEEGGAADSDVDAFFRTGRQGRARAAGGRAAAWDAAFRTSLGKEDCCWGVRVGGQSPSSRLELPRFLLLWQCWSPFGERWGLGSPRPSAFIPLRGVRGGEAGGCPLRRLLPERGPGRCWITLQRAAPATCVPGPSLGPRPPRSPAAVSPAPAALGWQPFSGQGSGALICKKRGLGDPESRRLQTDRSGADPRRSCRVRVGSQHLRLEKGRPR